MILSDTYVNIFGKSFTIKEKVEKSMKNFLWKKLPMSKKSVLYLLPTICALVLAGCSNTSSSASRIPTSKTSATSSSGYTPPPVKYNRSCEKTALSQIKMDECAASELGQVTKLLHSALSDENKYYGSGKVNSVQSSWDKYMKAECAMESGINKGGSILPLVMTDCEISETVSRIQRIDIDIHSANP